MSACRPAHSGRTLQKRLDPDNSVAGVQTQVGPGYPATPHAPNDGFVKSFVDSRNPKDNVTSELWSVPMGYYTSKDLPVYDHLARQYWDLREPGAAMPPATRPRLIAGRRAGPVFLSNLRPSPARAPAAGDICPVTGRARLSYRRSAELLAAQTGWTLHQFRHSALTHLAEADVQLPLLMAKSRHRSLRTLQRYARPGPDAVAALTAAHDPSRRR